jgi:hypothetical protein
MAEPKMLRLQGTVARISIFVSNTPSGVSFSEEKLLDVRNICEAVVSEVLGADFFVATVTPRIVGESPDPRMPPTVTQIQITAAIKSRLQFIERNRYRRMPWADLRAKTIPLLADIYDGEVSVGCSYGNRSLEGTWFRA